jgi:murein L,D-transpeptidase YcbB/YkuD
MKHIRTPRISPSPNVGAAGASAPDGPGRRDVRWLVAVLTVSALVLALIALALFQPSADAAAAPAAHSQLQSHAGHEKTSPPKALTAAQVAFHDQMRKLWEDHVTWTRLAIVTFADGSGGFSATAGRLLQNQTDIGNAVKPFYGAANGDHLAALLHDHITIAVEVLQAAKAGDTQALADANARWYANADDIADFLASLNPNWPQDALRADMKTHLDQTLAEASHELAADYSASVSDYEAVHAHILAMADMLSDGIMAQFPGRFH